jgi:hypothetical protein
MNSRHSDSEAVSDAMEMAVLSSVQHPNIVQVYSCLTDMVEVPAGERDLRPSAVAHTGCTTHKAVTSTQPTGTMQSHHPHADHIRL